LQKKTEDLKKEQQDLTARAEAMANKPEAGEKKPDEKGGEKKPDEKGGEKKPDEKGGEKKPDEKGGEKKPDEKGGEKKPDTPNALSEDQKHVAEKAKALAMDAKALAKIDPAFNKAGEKIDEAARNMFNAVNHARKDDMKETVIAMKRAQENIKEAGDAVQGMKWQSLEQGIDLAQAHAEKILREQVEVRARTRAIADKTDASGKVDAGQQRDLKGLARRQGENRVGTERLKLEIGTLRELAARGARAETAKAIDDANRSVERTQVVQKMTNAAVELDGLRAPAAAEEGAKAEAGAQAVVDRLRAAAGTLASDYKSELVRAKHEADRVAGDLAKLSGKPETGDAAEPKAPTPPTSGERAELGQRAAADLANLSRHLENRRMTPDEAGQLKKALDNPNVLAAVLASDEAKREQLRGIVKAVGTKLAAELEAKLQAERLKDFQREECPPQYRPLVNKYYEVLGQSAKD
ncbi:MAG: hypothetical protein NT049_19235, partial [Planctomycetota bacterium]|nr:hypothetical protein [Planctomycetota bacterium]